VAYQLKSDLARVCLPAPDRDAERRLAWVNSICIFFLIIGVFGAQSNLPALRKVPPLEQPVPVIIEPLPPAQTAPEQKPTEQNDTEKPDAPTVVAVTLNTPEINFSIPTIGTLLVPESAAPVPPPAELRQAVTVQSGPTRITSTGEGGDRPKPPYPEMAQQMGVQGTAVLQLTADDAGGITSIEIKESSGSPLLDRTALAWIKRHWIVPPINGSHLFVVAIHYTL